jgi:hypothetical protein
MGLKTEGLIKHNEQMNFLDTLHNGLMGIENIAYHIEDITKCLDRIGMTLLAEELHEYANAINNITDKIRKEHGKSLTEEVHNSYNQTHLVFATAINTLLETMPQIKRSRNSTMKEVE